MVVKVGPLRADWAWKGQGKTLTKRASLDVCTTSMQAHTNECSGLGSQAPSSHHSSALRDLLKPLEFVFMPRWNFFRFPLQTAGNGHGSPKVVVFIPTHWIVTRFRMGPGRGLN